MRWATISGLIQWPYKLLLDLDAKDLSVLGVELYDLSQDPAEQTEISAKHPDVVEKMRPIVEAAI